MGTLLNAADGTETVASRAMAKRFADALLAWWDTNGRKDLPWQVDRTPYRVWVSEVMLQQTQVAAVVPYFERFVARFPDVAALANADLDDVLHLWSGLGYYARARNLHRAARIVVSGCGGVMPDTVEALVELPGIGRSTAGAIVAQAFDRPATILDGNVRRVLARVHRVPGPPSLATTRRRLWQLAQAHTPETRAADYAQAIMDLGATVCRRTRPGCADCPVRELCAAHAADEAERYPQPAGRRPRRLEHRRYFVLTVPSGSCYVERRPSSGVWEGLFSPPERPADLPTAAFLGQLGVDTKLVESWRSAPPFRHGFTHFDLMVLPVYVRLRARPEDLPGTWVVPGHHRLGVSVVADKLLRATQPLELEP